jgi:hypothetical protein
MLLPHNGSWLFRYLAISEPTITCVDVSEHGVDSSGYGVVCFGTHVCTCVLYDHVAYIHVNLFHTHTPAYFKLVILSTYLFGDIYCCIVYEGLNIYMLHFNCENKLFSYSFDDCHLGALLTRTSTIYRNWTNDTTTQMLG